MVTDGLLDFILFAKIIYLEFFLKFPLVLWEQSPQCFRT